jgi:hypothetical protein
LWPKVDDLHDSRKDELLFIVSMLIKVSGTAQEFRFCGHKGLE